MLASPSMAEPQRTAGGPQIGFPGQPYRVIENLEVRRRLDDIFAVPDMGFEQVVVHVSLLIRKAGSMDRTSSRAIEEEYAFEEGKMAPQLASG